MDDSDTFRTAFTLVIIIGIVYAIASFLPYILAFLAICGAWFLFERMRRN